MPKTTEIVDVGLLSHWKRTRSFEEKDYGEVVWSANQFRTDLLPEEYMEKLEKFLGDGNATITVSQDLTTSEDFGNKAGAFVSVKVTCGNDEDNIRGAHSIARELVKDLVAEDYVESKKMLDDTRASGSPKGNKTSTASRVTSGKPRFRR